MWFPLDILKGKSFLYLLPNVCKKEAKLMHFITIERVIWTWNFWLRYSWITICVFMLKKLDENICKLVSNVCFKPEYIFFIYCHETFWCIGIFTEVKVYVDHILILVHITLTLIDITYCNLHHYRTTCGLLSISLW